MEWWNYAIFYLGSFFTLLWLYFIYYGYNLDKQQIFYLNKDEYNNNYCDNINNLN